MARPSKPQILSAEEQEKLALEAKEEVDQEYKEEVAKRFKDAEKLRIKRQLLTEQHAGPGEELETYTITLAPGPHDRIVIDGVTYMHGGTYKFNQAQLAVIKDQVHRTWMHDAEINGQDINAMNGRKKYAAVV